MKINNLLLCFLLYTIFLGSNTYAQEDITIGKIFTIESKVLQEEREILVSLPNGYEENKEVSYPVIYLLDGSTHFRYTSGIVKFLSDIRKAPPIIVVGIRNVDRMRDFTTPLKDIPSDDSNHHHSFSSNGGADNFLSFMETELITFINDKYRTDTFQIIAGHSIGGLFVIHCMLNKPELFNAYIACSPSLWWNDEELLDLANNNFEKGRRYEAKLYMAYGGIDGARVAPSCINFVKLLRKKAPDALIWETECLPNEMHKSTPLKSIYNGLEFIYKDWQGTKSGSIKESNFRY